MSKLFEYRQAMALGSFARRQHPQWKEKWDLLRLAPLVLNKCIGDDTKAAARQSLGLNCTKNKKRFSIWGMEFLHPAMCHDHDIDFARWLHPAMRYVVLESWQRIHQVAAPYNVIPRFGMTCHWIRPNVAILEFYIWFRLRPHHSSRHVILHQSPKFYPNRTTLGRKKWRHVNFQDGGSQPSWIFGIQ